MESKQIDYPKKTTNCFSRCEKLTLYQQRLKVLKEKYPGKLKTSDKGKVNSPQKQEFEIEIDQYLRYGGSLSSS